MNTTKRVFLLLIIMAVIIVSVGIFVMAYSFPKSINYEYPAIEFRKGNQSQIQKTSVRIIGTLRKPLFRNKEFHGRIIIEKYQFTKTYELLDITFKNNLMNGLGNMTYLKIDDGKPKLLNFGSIWTNDDFKNIKILIQEPTGAELSQSTDLEIISPANDYESAINIDQKFK